MDPEDNSVIGSETDSDGRLQHIGLQLYEFREKLKADVVALKVPEGGGAGGVRAHAALCACVRAAGVREAGSACA